MPYLSTGLAGCSVSLGISRDARKLTRTPRVTKKKKKGIVMSCSVGNSFSLKTVANVAPWILTVAASSLDRELIETFILEIHKF